MRSEARRYNLNWPLHWQREGNRRGRQSHGNWLRDLRLGLRVGYTGILRWLGSRMRIVRQFHFQHFHLHRRRLHLRRTWERVVKRETKATNQHAANPQHERKNAQAVNAVRVVRG